jgi:hypothetical protein
MSLEQSVPDHVAALPEAIRQFLEPPHIASIATVDPDGAPRQVVAWYRIEPDGRILLNSRPPRRWCTNLLRDRRLAISVIDAQDPYRWVGLTGLVDEIISDVDRARDDIVALAWRYHPDGPQEATIAAFRTQPRVTFLVRVIGIHDHLED